MFYWTRDSMWPRDHRVKSAKCCGHKSCRSGDRSILIFNVRKRIHMTILLQSVTIQFRRLFWHISYYKVRQRTFITKCDRLLQQSMSCITRSDRLLLRSASGITKCDRLYYKVREIFQSATVITKWDITPPNWCFRTNCL